MDLHKLLGTKFRVTIADGRAFEGIFECVDADCNVILSKAVEYPPAEKIPNALEEAYPPGPRFLESILLKGESINKLEIEA